MTLKDKIIAESLKFLKNKRVGELSLREIARRANVSHNAPYRHFKNKEALIKELAMEGFRLLSEKIDQRVPPPYSNIYSDLVASGMACLSFGLKNPAYLKIVFSRERPNLKSAKNIDFSQYDAFGRLLCIVEAGVANKQLVLKTPPMVFALNAWALVHGLSQIVLGKQIPQEMRNLKVLEGILKDNVYNMLFGAAAPSFKAKSAGNSG